MLEYIIYAGIIFIPIGYLLSLLLRRAGLSNKHIIVFLAMALLMIMSFPVTAERVGVFITGTIYVIFLIGFSWYLFKTKQFNYLHEPASDGLGNDDVLIPVVMTEMAAANDDSDMATYATDSLSAEIEDKATELGSTSDEVTEEPQLGTDQDSESSVLPENEIDQSQSQITHSGSVESKPGTEQITEELILPENEDHKSKSEPITGGVPEDIKLESEPTIDGSAATKNKEDLAVDNSSIYIDNIEKADKANEAETKEENINPAEIKEQPDNIDFDRSDQVIASVDEAIYQDIVDPQINVAADAEEEEMVDQINDKGTEKEQEQEVITLIDSGFAFKHLGMTLQVVHKFEEALAITQSSELKYLLTMELVENYKDLGRYNDARKVLEDVLRGNPDNVAIIKQVNNNLVYLSILANELEKLGAPETPVSMVPRWVRLKVAEEINLLDK